MEQSLGKRIMSHRKQLGLTQDQLAEKLGVTAQAVSKWENDQSCPDISMLPPLAQLFGITIDQLLSGQDEPVVHEAEVVTEPKPETDNDGFHVQKGNWEFTYDNSRKGSLGFAVLVLTVGGLLLASKLLKWNISFWDILWPSSLLVYGLFGLYPKFSAMRLGFALFGGYFLLNNLHILPFDLGGILLPVLLLLFGLHLLAEALRKPHKPKFSLHYNGNNKDKGSTNDFDVDGERFNYSASFGQATQYVSLPRMAGGEISVSFGDYTLDLTGVEETAVNCTMDANVSFGELTIRVPSRYQVKLDSNTAFGSIDVHGHPDTSPAGTIFLEANASFGELAIVYV